MCKRDRSEADRRVGLPDTDQASRNPPLSGFRGRIRMSGRITDLPPASPHFESGNRAGLGTCPKAVSYTHLRAHETVLDLVCRLLLEKKKNRTKKQSVLII